LVDVSTFESWLAKGLGRSAVFLENHDPASYLNALLYACIHNVTYDAQCEDGRTPYLWRLIQLSKHQAFFQNQVSKYLTEKHDSPDECDWAQLFGLARLFAAEGNAQMRRVMYSAFERLGFEIAGVSSAEEFIALDGFDGFVFAASRFDIRHPDNELWEIGSLISDLEDRLGKEQSSLLIAQAARRNQNLATVIEAVQQRERKIDEENADYKSRVSPTYLELKVQRSNSSWASELRRWSTTATPEEIKVAGDDFLFDEDGEKVWGFLRILNRRPFPGNPMQLLVLADDQRERVRRAAVIALSNVTHPDVRRRAQVLLQSKDRFADGARMLVSNYESGDFRILEDLLRQPMTHHEFHDLGFSVEYILKRNSTPDAEAALLLLYEKDPCSNCRESFVRFLINMNKIPDWMRSECRYDANAGTIEAVL